MLKSAATIISNSTHARVPFALLLCNSQRSSTRPFAIASSHISLSSQRASFYPIKAMTEVPKADSHISSGSKQALISLSDKKDLAFLGNGLQGLGYTIVSTGGTAYALENAGITVTKVEELTCFPEMGCMSNLGAARPSASASSPSTGLLGLLTGERSNSIPPMDFPLAKKSKITAFYTPKEKFAVLPNGVKIASQSSLLRNVNAKLGKLSINPHGLRAEMAHSGQVWFPKHRRGRVKGISCRGDHISFGRYALQALECAWITARQIEAGRRAVIRNARAGGKVWVRVIPDKSVTARPAETRMGRGKGAPAFMVACVKPGRVLYELGGVAENVARAAIKIAASKMPIRTRFIASE